MEPLAIVLVAVGWVLLGLAVGLWMARRGHDPRWAVIAVALGPLFVPIAIARVESRPRLAVPDPGGLPGGADAGGRRVLVGLDGSPEARHALARALDLLGPRCDQLMVAEVVTHDATEDLDRTDIGAATRRLEATVAQLSDCGAQAGLEVLTGPPGEALRRFAEEQGMDLLVVGRRGHGRSPHLLGSVSSYLVHHAAVPVLVVDPASD